MDIKFKKRLVHGNKGKTSWLGKKHSEESKKKMSLVKKGKHSSPKTEFKRGMIPWNKGISPSKESIEKMKKSLIERYAHNPELRKRLRNTGKKTWANPEYRKRQSEIHKKYFSNPEARKRQSEIIKGATLLNDTRFKKGHKFSEDIIKKIREATLKQYESGSFPKQENTKPEREIKKELLKRGYKEGIDFIHQYKFMNKFMCDFCFPKQKIIVEVYGDFWHANPIKYPAGKILHKHQMKGVGRDKSKEAYITKVDNHSWTYLVLWENDIKKDIVKCVDRIEEILAEKNI